MEIQDKMRDAICAQLSGPLGEFLALSDEQLGPAMACAKMSMSESGECDESELVPLIEWAAELCVQMTMLHWILIGAINPSIGDEGELVTKVPSAQQLLRQLVRHGVARSSGSVQLLHGSLNPEGGG